MILKIVTNFILGFFLFIINIFTSLFYCIYIAVLSSVQNFQERCNLFFSFKENTFAYKIFYIIYATIFTLPFLAMLLTECLVLSAIFIVFKWIDKAFSILAIITGTVGGVVFLISNYTLYYLTNIITCLPNFLLATYKPLTYSEISIDLLN